MWRISQVKDVSASPWTHQPLVSCSRARWCMDDCSGTWASDTDMEMSHRCANTICLFYFLYSLYNCFKFTHYSCRQWNNRPHSSTFSVRLSMLVNKDFSFSLYVFLLQPFILCCVFYFLLSPSPLSTHLWILSPLQHLLWRSSGPLTRALSLVHAIIVHMDAVYTRGQNQMTASSHFSSFMSFLSISWEKKARIFDGSFAVWSNRSLLEQRLLCGVHRRAQACTCVWEGLSLVLSLAN